MKVTSSFVFLQLSLSFPLFLFRVRAQYPYDCSINDFSEFASQLRLNATVAQNVKNQLDQHLCSSTSNATEEGKASLACYVSRILAARDATLGGIPSYVDRQSPEYVNRTEVNWSDDCWLSSNCILAPRTPDEVAQFLKILTFIGSKFAVRSGGHNPNVGFGSIGPTGVLIDMVHINQTTLSRDRQTVSIGAGQRLGPAYAALDQLGYYFNGGKDPNPAVGGFYLGGGITYFMSEYGIGANGLKNIEVVLANSSVIEANSNSHADLLWAIGGGGPNYGIITRYDVEAFPKPYVWFEYRLYNPDKLQQLLSAMVQYQRAAEADNNASIVFQSFPTQTLVGFIHKGGVIWPTAFAAFKNVSYNATYVASTIGSPYQLAEATAGAQAETQLKYASISVALRPDLEVYKESYATYLEIAEAVAKNFSGLLAYGIQPVTSSGARQTKRNGGTPLNLTPVSQTWFICEVEWADSAASEAALAAVEHVGAAVQAAAAKRNVSLPFCFMNDANYRQNIFGSYGAGSLAQLRSIASKYDPTGVFQNLQNDGYLLSKAG